MKQRASGDVRRTGAAAHIDMGCPGSRQHSNERRPRAQNKEKPMYILNQQKQIIYLYQDCKQIHTNKCHNNNNSSRHHTQQEKKFIEEVLHIVNSKNRCLKYVIQAASVGSRFLDYSLARQDWYTRGSTSHSFTR